MKLNASVVSDSRRSARIAFVPRCHIISAATLLGIAMMVSACGNSSSGDDPEADPIVNMTSTSDLKDSASSNIGGSLDTALDGFSRVTSGSGGTDGNQSDPTNTGVGGLWGNDAQSLINTSLALEDDESTVRDGSRITIDPDDAAVCAESLVDMDADQAEIQRCQTLVSDMIVQIDATSDTAGTMTYLFQSQPLAIIGYTATSNSFELNFGTLKTLIDAESALNPEVRSDSPLDTIQGAIRVIANTTNTTVGAEAGSVALEVTQPVAVVSADAATSMSLGLGKVIAITADAGTESVSIELAVGALQASDSDEGTVSSMDMKGLTAIIDVDDNADVLTVRNLGIGQGPLRISLDNNEVLNMGLDTFGFSVSGSGENITLDGALNLSLMIKEVFDDNTVSDTLFALLEMTAPAGTQLSEQLNGSLMVASGGPLSYSLTSPDDNDVLTVDQLTVNAGQCADDVGVSDADQEIVSCQ